MSEEVVFTSVKDSGDRSVVELTGSRRDRRPGKGLPHLIPPLALRRLAIHFENGAAKYGVRNWEKGQPLSWFWDSAFRHLLAILEGDESEDHPAAVMWNAACLIDTEDRIKKGELPKELDDLRRVKVSQMCDFYLSGPMTGIEDHNKPMFNAAAKYLREQGFTVLNPAELDDLIPKHELEKWQWEDYLRRDLIAMLQRCRNIILLPDWQKSDGANLEYHLFHSLKREIWYIENKDGVWNHYRVN